MHIRNNLRERKIIKKYQEMGFEVLTKGWPDLLCYKPNTGELKMVEVKRKQKKPSVKMGLSQHQKRMHEILRAFGFEVILDYVD